MPCKQRAPWRPRRGLAPALLQHLVHGERLFRWHSSAARQRRVVLSSALRDRARIFLEARGSPRVLLLSTRRSERLAKN